MKHFWKSGLKEEIWEKLESVGVIESRRPTIERTSAQTPKARIERACVHAYKKRIDRSVIKRTLPTIERICA
jgi:hypothetical protein